MTPTLADLMTTITRELPTAYLVEQRTRGIARGGTTPHWPDVRQAIETTLTERGVELEVVR